MNFRRLRRLVVAVDTGEVFQFAAPRLRVQPFDVAALAFLQRRIDKNFDELAGRTGCAPIGAPLGMAK